MKKQIFFLWILIFSLIIGVFSVSASSIDNEAFFKDSSFNNVEEIWNNVKDISSNEEKLETVDEAFVSPYLYLEEAYKDVFYNLDTKSEKEFLVDIKISEDTEFEESLQYIISGTILFEDAVESDEDLEEDTYIIIMLHEEDGVFVPLESLDENYHFSHILEEAFLFLTNVKCNAIENEEQHKIRIITFKLGEELVLNENLQITDKIINEKEETIINKIKNSFQDTFENIFSRMFQSGD